ncbi:YlbF family regulator [Bacillus marinisedimentorum]|uniref:YlbF family regulator n=1 Tax=Bacillus marinisedimentorum TaxID=1821260 RepID=UPI0008722B4D|nr:YlbF family regulator [Bacillus marinisedimentorum]
MLATLESIQIIDQAEELSAMMFDSDMMENYRRSKEKMESDPEALELIAAFSKLKEQYEEVQRFGKYHPDFKKVTTEVMELKRKLDLHDTIAEFKKAEEELQEVLDEISQLLGKAVSDQIKVPSGNPFFDSLSGCGGGCGSGGSCGCSA